MPSIKQVESTSCLPPDKFIKESHLVHLMYYYTNCYRISLHYVLKYVKWIHDIVAVQYEYMEINTE